MTIEEFEMRTLVRESDVIDRTDGSELAKAFNYLWEKYVEQQPCEDAIRREDALMALTGEWTELTDELIHRFIKRIKNLPPVNPQQKTGYWILTSDDDYEYCTCSECGYQNGENWMIGSQIKFCQECGAKMQEVEE